MTAADQMRKAAQAALAVIADGDAHGEYCVVSFTASGRAKAHPEAYETKAAAAAAARRCKSANPESDQVVVFAGTRAIWVLGTGGAVLGSFDRGALRAASRRRPRP